MFETLVFIFFLFVGFAIILKSSDIFVDSAETMGKKFKLSPIVTGLTIVALGTSLPELFTSVGAILFTEHYSQFIIGTIMGSNITNILLIFGLFLIFAGNFSIKKSQIVNVLTLIFVTFVLLIFVFLGFVNYFAIGLIVFYVLYVVYEANYQKREIIIEEKEIVALLGYQELSSYFVLLGSVGGLYFGSKLVVSAIEGLGSIFVIPAAFLSLTTVAIGTSLPEIAVSINTAMKKEYLIGIGNVIGSNIINIALVFGLSGFFGRYAVNTGFYYMSIAFLVIGTMFFSAMLLRKNFHRYQGLILLGLYILYILSFFFFN